MEINVTFIHFGTKAFLQDMKQRKTVFLPWRIFAHTDVSKWNNLDTYYYLYLFFM